MEPNTSPPLRPESERLDNAPLRPKYRDDAHIAGSAELRTAVELSVSADDDTVDRREELDEMEVDATAALAEGMGADDARNQSLNDEPPDERESDLRTDLDEETQESPEDEDVERQESVGTAAARGKVERRTR